MREQNHFSLSHQGQRLGLGPRLGLELELWLGLRLDPGQGQGLVSAFGLALGPCSETRLGTG